MPQPPSPKRSHEFHHSIRLTDIERKALIQTLIELHEMVDPTDM